MDYNTHQRSKMFVVQSHPRVHVQVPLDRLQLVAKSNGNESIITKEVTTSQYLNAIQSSGMRESESEESESLSLTLSQSFLAASVLLTSAPSTSPFLLVIMSFSSTTSLLTTAVGMLTTGGNSLAPAKLNSVERAAFTMACTSGIFGTLLSFSSGPFLSKASCWPPSEGSCTKCCSNLATTLEKIIKASYSSVAFSAGNKKYKPNSTHDQTDYLLKSTPEPCPSSCARPSFFRKWQCSHYRNQPGFAWLKWKYIK